MVNSERTENLTQHTVINAKEPVKVVKVLKGAAVFQGSSLNQYIVNGIGLLEKLSCSLVSIFSPSP